MLNRVLVANRGECAVRIVRACHDLGIEAVAVYSTADREGLWVELADRAVCIGPHQPAESYLNVRNLIGAAETLPKSRTAPAGCMAVLGAVSDEWPTTIAREIRKVRLDMLGNLRGRLEAAVASGELPAATDIDALSRFYLSVFEGMAIQAKDGATPEELGGVAKAAMAMWPGER